MSLRSIHHDSERWSDPEVFRPERYLNEKGEFLPDEGLCPFGLGKSIENFFQLYLQSLKISLTRSSSKLCNIVK